MMDEEVSASGALQTQTKLACLDIAIPVAAAGWLRIILVVLWPFAVLLVIESDGHWQL